MKRALSVVFVATLAASPVAVVAQERMPAAPLHPRFNQEAIGRAVSAATQNVADTRQTDAGAAADINRSWDALVGTVRTGKKVTVTLVNATSLEGKLVAIDAHSIGVDQPGAPRTIEATDVIRVRYAGIRKRHVLYGMLIGMAGGALANVVIDKQSSHPSSTIEAAGLGAIFFGLPGGAVGGALVPVGQPLYEVASHALIR